MRSFVLIEGDPSTPTQQLMDLKKVLQSDFFKSVREVYEHIYKTVEPQGNTDARAHATAKVCNFLNSTALFILNLL